jgi:hypothetical protein
VNPTGAAAFYHGEPTLRIKVSRDAIAEAQIIAVLAVEREAQLLENGFHVHQGANLLGVHADLALGGRGAIGMDNHGVWFLIIVLIVTVDSAQQGIPQGTQVEDYIGLSRPEGPFGGKCATPKGTDPI